MSVVRIVFVGGTRFIGHWAATAALARGHDVVTMHRGQHPLEVAGAREERVDRGDPSALARAIALARPDVVVDTLAMTRADAEATVLAVKITRVPFVVLSSQDVYAAFGAVLGHPAPPPEPRLTEASPLTVPFPYRGITPEGDRYDKKEVERVVQAAHAAGELAAACVLRLPAVYGARDYRRRFGPAVDHLDAGLALPCAGGAAWRWTHADVRDVAHAIVLAAERTSSGFAIYNVGEPSTPTMRERVETIAAAMGVTATWDERPEPLDDAWRAFGRGPDIVVDSSRIRAELGFTEVTRPDERIRDLIRACRETRAGETTPA